MKYLLLLLLVCCASRFENFDKIDPGMTKVDLRSEMTMVEGVLNFPPYEFRTYSGGLVVLKDDIVVRTFASADEQDFEVKTVSRGGKSLIYAPIYIAPLVGNEGITDRLKLLLRLRGYTVTANHTGSVAVMKVLFKSAPAHLQVSVETAANPHAFWSIDVEPQSDDDIMTLLPVMIAAVVERFNVQKGKETWEVRATNPLLQVTQNAGAIQELLQQDKTLRD